jgi:hypothetical protein
MLTSDRTVNIDLCGRMLDQDARQVHTRCSKTFTSWFFPVGDDIERIVVDWVGFLRAEKGFGPEDPIFPKTKVETSAEIGIHADGLDRDHCANANAIRSIFKEAFARTGLPYFNPHSFRKTLVQMAYARNLGPEQFKAWSQNLGHDHCLTTFSSYGTIPPARQAEILRGLALPVNPPVVDLGPEVLRRIADQMERTRLGA